MIKLIGIVIIFFGILLILGGLNSPSSTGGLDFGFIVGVMLAIVGALIFMYDPVEDAKNRVMRGAEHVMRASNPVRDVEGKVEDVKKDVQKTTDQTTADARKRINALAKEVQKMTE